MLPTTRSKSHPNHIQLQNSNFIWCNLFVLQHDPRVGLHGGAEPYRVERPHGPGARARVEYRDTLPHHVRKLGLQHPHLGHERRRLPRHGARPRGWCLWWVWGLASTRCSTMGLMSMVSIRTCIDTVLDHGADVYGEYMTKFPPALENLEKWDNFFQPGESQGILKKCQKVREKSGNFKWVRDKSGKTVIHKLKFNQSRIKILLYFSHQNYSKIPFFWAVYGLLLVRGRPKLCLMLNYLSFMRVFLD